VAEALVGLVGLAFVGWAAFADDGWFQLHLMPYYCVTKAGALGRAHVMRGLAAAIGIVFLLLVRPRAGRRAERSSPRDAGAFAAKTALAVVLAFVVTDLVLRYQRAHLPPPPPARVDQVQRPKKEATVTTNGGRDVHYAFNAEGLRTRTAEDVIDHEAPTVLFSGESVALGYGIDYEDTIPARVGNALKMQTANLAVSSYGNDEIFVRLRDYLPRFRHPAAVVTFVVFNAIFRNAIDYRWRLVIGPEGALVFEPPATGLLHDSPLFGKLRAIYHSSAAADVTRAVVRETDELVRRAGAKPIFVFTQCAPERCLPSGSGGPWLRDYIKKGLSIDAVDVDFDPADVQPSDFHPTAHGLDAYVGPILDALHHDGLGV
jgi:hypothetical protein